MEDSDEEQAVSKLTKRATKIQIDDRDVNEWEQVQSAFFEHYNPLTVSRFRKESKSTTSGSGNNPPPPNLFSDTFCDGTTILCGFAGGTCRTLDVNRLSSEEVVLNAQTTWKHSGLTCLRCSRVSPFTFFSSSTDGTIRLWDVREEARKPSQKFALDEASEAANTKDKPKKKPILQFDVSSSDQLLGAGTELVKEDSYLLFWDVRSGKSLGAYWESHSDDVTAVRFHPHQNHCLATGSTDGLLNVFNLLETAEEDALQYSFNTNSSVDSVHWSNSESTTSSIMTCVTHTNEVQVWDALTGDRIAEINRKLLAETMMRSNPDAVYITSCYNLENSAIGLMTCSLSGGNTRLIELDSEMKPKPRGLFMDQTAVIQTAEYLSKAHRWATFDENGIIKLWHLQSPSPSEKKQKRSKNISSEDKRNKRFKPYNRD
ncbi:WD repeat-containing protein 89 [Orchesella cincta]|uniref:WD repeat-containing protein 89 n=1 Tax=Orchesella cincta TaxID=48709 RepID=A0A1D2MU85_ORCCI|nr:WD repeat-containing protein 89 [Orchesella cincta]